MTAQTILPANTLSTGGFQVDNSAMFNSGDSAYMTKEQGTATVATKYTLSMWIKRSKLGAEMNLIGVSSGNTIELIKFNADNSLRWYNRDASSNAAENTATGLFSDTSAWYHFVFVYDSTQSGAANQRKFYLNGVNQTWASANAVQANAVPGLNLDGADVNIGAESSPSNYFGGYMSEVNFIDGQRLTADSFGESDEDSGIWKPIDASGLTFGNNGFYLDFKASGNLGNDANGGTDFAETNFAATDQGIDTCTNNFPTLNILAPSASGLDIRQGNTLVFNDNNVNIFQTVPATMTITPTGKFYWEIFCKGVWGTAACEAHGIADVDNMIQTLTGQASDGATSFAWQNNASFRSNGGTVSSTTWAVTYATNDYLMFALDNANGALYAGKNGTWLNSGDPTSGASKTGALAVTVGLNYAPHSEVKYGSDKPFYNFGSPYYAISSGNADGDGIGNFEYAVPSGYFALCTKNLAEYG